MKRFFYVIWLYLFVVLSILLTGCDDRPTFGEMDEMITPTPTDVPLLVITDTPMLTSTNTPLPTPTATDTPLPTSTNTPLPTPTATDTPLPTSTNTPLPTPTATDTPLPTSTNTPLPTPTATDTPLPTSTNTPLPTPTATDTPLPTSTNTPLPTQTATSTPRPTVTNTPKPTPTPATTTAFISVRQTKSNEYEVSFRNRYSLSQVKDKLKVQWQMGYTEDGPILIDEAAYSILSYNSSTGKAIVSFYADRNRTYRMAFEGEYALFTDVSGSPSTMQVSSASVVFDKEEPDYVYSDLVVTLYDDNDVDVTDKWANGKGIEYEIEVDDESGYIYQNNNYTIVGRAVKNALVFSGPVDVPVEFTLRYYYDRYSDSEIVLEAKNTAQMTFKTPYEVVFEKSMTWCISTSRNMSDIAYYSNGVITGLKSTNHRIILGDDKQKAYYLYCLIKDNRSGKGINADSRERYKITFMSADPNALMIDDDTGRIIANKSGKFEVVAMATDQWGKETAVGVLTVEVASPRTPSRISVTSGSLTNNVADSDLSKYNTKSVTFSLVDQYGSKISGEWDVKNVTDTRSYKNQEGWLHCYGSEETPISKSLSELNANGGARFVVSSDGTSGTLYFKSLDSARSGGSFTYTYEVWCGSICQTVTFTSFNVIDGTEVKSSIASNKGTTFDLSPRPDSTSSRKFDLPVAKFYLTSFYRNVPFADSKIDGVVRECDKNIMYSVGTPEFDDRNGKYYVVIKKNGKDVLDENGANPYVAIVNGELALTFAGVESQSINYHNTVDDVSNGIYSTRTINVIDYNKGLGLGDYTVEIYRSVEILNSSGVVVGTKLSSTPFKVNSASISVVDTYATKMKVEYVSKVADKTVTPSSTIKSMISNCLKFKLGTYTYYLNSNDLFFINGTKVGDRLGITSIDFYVYGGSINGSAVYYKSNVNVGTSVDIAQ